MSLDVDELKPQSMWEAIKRGLKGKCPNCGKGQLFRAYLKPVDACSHCNAKLAELRADDGPAWLTILIERSFLRRAHQNRNGTKQRWRSSFLIAT